ncbi:phage tail-collar fiber domain-containing protein [Chitinimonas sp. PSY-7]|uniref:phage tail-collar fiber domain-containing protein n=1 Tax=Chitinimonas sp. PSY-7 TaxID=3459088 RepID=UPI00403FDF73
MTPLVPVIQQAALSAIQRADATGIALQITHIAIGTTAYAPTQGHTALKTELARYRIASGNRLSPTLLHMDVLADGLVEGWVREVGVICNDNILLAVWSHPDQVIGFKPANQTLAIAFDLDLSVLPAGSVTINTTAPNFNLAMAEHLSVQAAMSFYLARLQLEPLLKH